MEPVQIGDRPPSMKYADAPTGEVEVVVHAPADRVFALVTDLDLPSRFSNEFRGADWIDRGPRVGARFTGHNEHPAIGAWDSPCVVTRYEPDRVFEWVVGEVDNPSAKWRFELEPDPDDDDVVRLRQCCQLGPGPSGLSAAIVAMPDKEERIVRRRLDEFLANMRATVEGIKRIAEGTS